MPSIRVTTWNSGGEAGGRGAALAAAVLNVNGGPAPAVKLVAIQEARANIAPPQGSIYQQLNAAAGPMPAPPFGNFAAPPENVRELNPVLQPYAVGVNRAYLLGWDPTGPGLVSAGAAARVSLAPAPGNGVANYINGLPIGIGPRNALRVAARNIRAPVRKVFTLTLLGVAHTIYFYTWHAELQANWLAATWATVGLLVPPFAGPGMYPAFQFFQNCDQFQADIAALTANDVLVIAGDLNITAADIGHPGIFPLFQAASNHLSHVLAFKAGGPFAVANGAHYVTAYPPHAIVVAEVQW